MIAIDNNFQFTKYCLNSFVSAIVEGYKNEGNDVYINDDFLNAIYFYTKGIKVKCGNKELKAKLYNNRASAHFKLGKNTLVLLSLHIFTFLLFFHQAVGLTESLR